jgi:hypothetical protein
VRRQAVVAVALLVAGLVTGLVAGPARADEPAVPLADAVAILGERAACVDAAAPIACLLEGAYAGDPKALAAALALYRDHGDVAGAGAAETMDGGFRGTIELVPALPVGRRRGHLAWVVAAAGALDAFYGALGGEVAEGRALRYRWRGLAVRFVRSVKRHTPSAYAMPWAVTYNVEGSLLTSADAVTETLVHEIFHMNDADHGDWSATHLAADYDAIRARCGGDHPSTPCLAPYAPNATRVRGGTYYAFQPNNGATVHEYAAELALRYFHEQREVRRRGKLAARAFKCGPVENARAWAAMVDEFFAGVDRVPACR